MALLHLNCVYRSEVIRHSCKLSIKPSSLLYDLNFRSKPPSLTALPGLTTCLNVPIKELGNAEGLRGNFIKIAALGGTNGGSSGPQVHFWNTDVLSRERMGKE